MVATRGRWAVLGAGSWGTVLAAHLARAGHTTQLWTHQADHCRAMVESGANEGYVPGLRFPPGLTPTADLEAALGAADTVLIAVPSDGFESVVDAIAPHLEARHGLVWATKGFHPRSHRTLDHVARDRLGESVPLAAISGPTFAGEVARALPCALVVASPDRRFARRVAGALQSDYLLPFTSTDLTGVQVGGATKNVIAIATGIADGMELGSNARAALITRGLREITALGRRLGGRRDTFVGLSGLGDLVLTCSDDQSRNRRFGLTVGSGTAVAEARRAVGQAVEGIVTATTVHELAEHWGITMPICSQVHQVIHHGKAPRQAVAELLSQPPRPEFAPQSD